MIASSNNKRVITTFILVMLNVSIMASLRNLPLVAELGYQMFFAFIIIALAFLIPCALVSAELATGWSESGGIYIWVREAFGDRWGFFSIWMQWAHNVTWYPAILSFVGTTISYIINPELAHNKLYIQAVVLIIFWGMTLVNYFGIGTSSLISTIGVIVGTLIPGALIIILGIIWVCIGNSLQLPFSINTLIPDFSSPSSLVFLAGLFLSFAGLEVSAGYAGEVKDPQKNFPKAIMIAAGIVLCLFMFGAFAIAVVIPKDQINLIAGLMDALHVYLSNYRLNWTFPFFAGLLVIGAIAEVNSWVIGPIKALYTTSVHGNLPPFFHNLNKRGTPTHLLLFQSVIVTIVSCIILYMPSTSAAYWVLTIISTQMYLVMYLFMFFSAIRLRYTHSHVHRAYRIPHPHKGIWLIASIGAFASLFALIIGYIPPKEFDIGSLFIYEFTLIFSLLIMMVIPLVIYKYRKPSWMPKRSIHQESVKK